MKHMAGLCVALLLACLGPSHAADKPPPDKTSPEKLANGKPRPDYGIRVGEAKVYDDLNTFVKPSAASASANGVWCHASRPPPQSKLGR